MFSANQHSKKQKEESVVVIDKNLILRTFEFWISATVLLRIHKKLQPKWLIHLYPKIYYALIRIRSFWRKKIFFGKKKLLQPKNWTFSRELTLVRATKSNILLFQTFANLSKSCEIAKLCFARVSYFKVFIIFFTGRSLFGYEYIIKIYII